MKEDKIARRNFSYGLDHASGTWKSLFHHMYDPAFITFETEKLKKKILNDKYSEKTYRRFCYMLYWFIYYAKPNYHYETMEFQENWLSGVICEINDDRYVVSFKPKDGMPVPDSIGKQFNPQKQTYEEYREYERKHRIHCIEPLY